MTARPMCALGVAPHSGWAAVVAATEVDSRLRVLARERMALAEADDPESKQPYHAVEGLPVEEAAQRLAAYGATARRMAGAFLLPIVTRLEGDGYEAVGLAILDSSGRKGSALSAILASHALIHTADGDHFRDAIAAAAEGAGLRSVRVPAREVEARVAAAVGRPAEALRRVLKETGRELGPPWTADQKSAALLAWLVLCDRAAALGAVARAEARHEGRK